MSLGLWYVRSVGLRRTLGALDRRGDSVGLDS